MNENFSEVVKCGKCDQEERTFWFLVKLTKEHPRNWCWQCRGKYCLCLACSAEFEKASREDSYCSDACVDRARKQEIARKQVEWIRNCDALLQETDPGKLPRIFQATKTASWQYGPRGLILYGKSGTGKTRSTFLLLQRLVGEGYSVQLIRGMDFQKEVHERTMGKGDFTEWFEPLLQVDVLAFDDFDKAKFSPRVEAEAYNLIDSRTMRKLPIILSVNSGGKALARKLSEETGPAIIRRITEFCEPINFDKEQHSPRGLGPSLGGHCG